MYERILVPVDGSPTSNRGLQEAIRLAKLTGARLRLLHVTDVLSLALGSEGYAGPSSDLLLQVRKAGEAILEQARDTTQAEGVPVDTVAHENVSGRLSELVADEAAKWPADLVVLGTHGRRGVRRLVLGSDAEQIARTAPVPVLLVRDKTQDMEHAP
jgi:nucleotide-binding universal stress UspA family protein